MANLIYSHFSIFFMYTPNFTGNTLTIFEKYVAYQTRYIAAESGSYIKVFSI